MKIIITIVLALGLSFSFNVDVFDTYSAEGFTAYVSNAQGGETPAPKPTPTPTPTEECKCGGTGKIKQVDGNIVGCPCGADCKCKKATAVVSNKRVLLFTDSKGCAPCKRFKDKIFPKLSKAKWTMGIESTNHIQVYDMGNQANWDTAKMYGLNENIGIPYFVLIENNQVVRTLVGCPQPKEFTDFYYGK